MYLLGPSIHLPVPDLVGAFRPLGQSVPTYARPSETFSRRFWTACELLRPTGLGPTRHWLVAVGASRFCVGNSTRRHSGPRIRRRLPFTSGSECPTPVGWTLGHNRRRALRVASEHRRRRGEHRPLHFDGRGKAWRGRERNSYGRCIPSLLRLLRSLRGGRGSAITAHAIRRFASPHSPTVVRSVARSAASATASNATTRTRVPVSEGGQMWGRPGHQQPTWLWHSPVPRPPGGLRATRLRFGGGRSTLSTRRRDSRGTHLSRRRCP